MSNYSQVTAFTPKDSLASGNPSKVIRGSEFDGEFSAISTAIASKADEATTTTALATKRGLNETTSVISTNTNAVAGYTYVLTADLTLTLPATPTSGQFVTIVNRSGVLTPIVGRNGSNIMGLAEDMTINSLNASLTLMYADATRGWVWI